MATLSFRTLLTGVHCCLIECFPPHSSLHQAHHHHRYRSSYASCCEEERRRTPSKRGGQETDLNLASPGLSCQHLDVGRVTSSAAELHRREPAAAFGNCDRCEPTATQPLSVRRSSIRSFIYRLRADRIDWCAGSLPLGRHDGNKLKTRPTRCTVFAVAVFALGGRVVVVVVVVAVRKKIHFARVGGKMERPLASRWSRRHRQLQSSPVLTNRRAGGEESEDTLSWSLPSRSKRARQRGLVGQKLRQRATKRRASRVARGSAPSRDGVRDESRSPGAKRARRQTPSHKKRDSGSESASEDDRGLDDRGFKRGPKEPVRPDNPSGLRLRVQASVARMVEENRQRRLEAAKSEAAKSEAAKSEAAKSKAATAKTTGKTASKKTTVKKKKQD